MWRSVRIKDSSGGIVVAGVRGDVEIDDSSGEIELRVVEGFVAVSDSSSEIAASGIAGSVIVHRDSSGPIRVTDLGGDFSCGRSDRRAIKAPRFGNQYMIVIVAMS